MNVKLNARSRVVLGVIVVNPGETDVRYMDLNGNLLKARRLEHDGRSHSILSLPSRHTFTAIVDTVIQLAGVTVTVPS